MSSPSPAADARPVYSVVLLSYNSARYLEPCITALMEAFTELGASGEVRVVENGSVDTSAAILRDLEARYPDRLAVRYLAENCGTTVSRNLAVADCRGEYLLILDSDALISAPALGLLTAALEADDKVGIAVPRLDYPDGRFQISTDDFPTVTRKLQRFLALKSMEQAAVAPATPVEVDYAISACWLMRRSLYDRVGPLDEKIFYSPEDVDYCVRVWQAGFSVLYVPDAVVIHDAQELSRGRKLGSYTARHAAGLLYYFRKYGYAFNRRRFCRRIGRFG